MKALLQLMTAVVFFALLEAVVDSFGLHLTLGFIAAGLAGHMAQSNERQEMIDRLEKLKTHQ